MTSRPKAKARARTRAAGPAAHPALNLPLTKKQHEFLGGHWLLGYQGLRERGVPHHRTYLWELMNKQRFPRPVPLGPGKFARKAWRVREVEEWLANQPLIQLASEEA